MAKYKVYSPAYVRGEYLARDAFGGNPEVIYVADDVEPSYTWEPMDEAAQVALVAQGERQIKKLCFEMDPEKDKGKIEKIAAETRKKYRKPLVNAPEPKPAAPVADTNSEIAAGGAKVVGRASDRSPVK